MRILLVGSIEEDKWIGSLIRALKKNDSELQIDFFNIHNSSKLTTAPFYALCNRTFSIKERFPAFLYRIPKVRAVCRRLDLLYPFRDLALEMQAKREKYDAVNFHFLLPWEAENIKYIKAISKKIVVSPWGSDILRASDDALKQVERLAAAADYVTCGRDVPRFAADIVRLLHTPKEKLVRIGFATEMIDLIQEHADTTRDAAKARLGLDGRYVVACGYNANPAQHHLQVIDAIQSVRDKLPANITLLLQMTYGAPREYIESVIARLDELRMPHLILDKYLTNDELLSVRKCADMFIHGQKTDANSGSLAEYLLCGAKVINGSWLKYPNREKFGTPYYTFDNFEELGSVLVKACQAETTIIPAELPGEILKDGWNYEGREWNKFFRCCADDNREAIAKNWGVKAD